MDFDSAAKKIVSDSICSAVCIDNVFVEPYTHMEDPEESNYKTPKELYESFKKQNCVLDVYKYVDFENWEKKKESILKGKDLLILDWELSDGALPFKDTLVILHEAVKTESLPFVYIYTQEIDLDKVVLNISSYFSGNTLEKLTEKYDLLCKNLDDSSEVEDANKLLRGMTGICKEIVVYPHKIKGIRSQILGYFKEKLELDTTNTGKFYGNFIDIGVSVFKCEDEDNFLKNLGLFLNIGRLPKEPVPDVDIISIEGERYAYLIHNTVVKISTKKSTATGGASADIVSAEEVYSELSKTICSRPQNFLALLGLELRNFYRDSSSVIGKDINEIDEIAFFQHQNSLKGEDDERFHEFLKNIWKDEISSFLLDQKPILFSVLEDYKAKKDVSGVLKSQKNDLLIQHLSRLNYYYSISRSQHKLSRKIRFGDIFSFKEEYLFSWKEIPGNDSEKLKYFLKSEYDVDWIKTAKIAKTVNCKTIMITDGTNVLSLNLYNENTELKIIIDNDKTYKLIVKDENGELNIYKEETSLPIDSFVLCITPHCDCLRPKKNGFFFVNGNEINLKKGLEIGDSGFISFIIINEKIICIEWKTSPFMIHIPIDFNNIIRPIECDLSGKKIILNHLVYQKENYTQRIANESFSKANRVGIDFAKLEEETK